MSLFLLAALLLPANGMNELEAAAQPSGYPHADLLVEPGELARPEMAKQFLILDARGKHKYAAGHIPGAIWVDQIGWSRVGIAAPDGKRWARRIGELGIDNDSRVVVYDDNASKDAARIWWILRF